MIKMMLTIFLILFNVSMIAQIQTSEFSRIIRNVLCNPKSGLDVDLYDAGTANKLYDLSEDGSIPGRYYHATVAHGLYDIWVGGALKQEDVWVGGNKLSIIADNFDASGDSLNLDIVNAGEKIYLPTTTGPNSGVFYFGADRFIHNYAHATADGLNTFIGVGAGNFTMSPGGGASALASFNVGVGTSVLSSNTTGSGNVGVGKNVLSNNTTGVYNIGIGSLALLNNTTGDKNIGIGKSALSSATTGYYNTAIGYFSLAGNTTGYGNTAIGMFALFTADTGYHNVAVGYKAMNLNTSGYYNVAVGVNSQENNTTGIQNTSLGMTSLRQNTTGKYNTALGTDALYFNTTGSYNIGVGVEAVSDNTVGNDNVSVGYQSLDASTKGSGNTAVGRGALMDFNVTSAANTRNTAIGFNTGRGIITGIKNTIVGASVTGLDAALNNNIILSDGDGTIKMQIDSLGFVTFPLIGSDSTSVTTGYLWFNSTTGAIHRKF